MSDRYPILITGINGFIGGALAKSIRKKGYDVWGLDISSSQDKQTLGVNLLDKNALIKVCKKLPKCSFLIHTAALAHGQKPPKGETVISTNTKITDNIIELFEKKISHIIFFSSVAVYGEANRKMPILISDDLRPSTNYGTSKLICEKKILKSSFKNSIILRSAPIYDQWHMQDVRKRVYLPGFTSIKMILIPSPQYSLANIETVINNILILISKKSNGHFIYNLSDLKTFSQKELTHWFTGKEVKIPIFLTKPFYFLSYILPKNIGYKFRCLYWKLFCSNIYDLDK